jgi:hypothetical protein
MDSIHGVKFDLLPDETEQPTVRTTLGDRAPWEKRDPRSRRARMRAALAAARVRLRGARSRLKRRSFEAGATIRSSAAIAGLSRDARAIGHRAEVMSDKVASGVAAHLPKESAAVDGLRRDLGVVRARLSRRLQAAARRLDRGGKRAQAQLMRSAFVSGLAIDSRRVVKRVRHRRHGPGSAH